MAISSGAAELIFRAAGDTDDARKEFSKLRSEIKDTTTEGKGRFESFTQSLGLSEKGAASLAGALPLIGAAATAAATVAVTAAVSIARSLFEASKEAADFGSQIFDAGQKTGLSAEKLSAMKFAADQSGTSLETITQSAAKFARTIDSAGQGSEKAKDVLDRLGVTSSDLDTALAQALKTIAETEDGTEQMALAMAAFGRSGADLLPFIKSFDGDLDGLVRKAKQLGVTIDDEAARAADEFGDTLDTLNAQLTAVGRTVGFAVMPQFTKLATELSDWIGKNQGEISRWGSVVARVMEDSVSALRKLVNFIYENQTPIRVALAIGTLGLSEGAAAIGTMLGELSNQAQAERDAASGGQPAGAGGQGARSPGAGEDDPSARAPKVNVQVIERADSQGDFNRRATAYAQKSAAERLAIAEQEMRQALEIYRAGYAKRFAELEERFKNEKGSLAEHVRDLGKIREDAIRDEIEKNKKLLTHADLTAEKRKEIDHRIKVLEIELKTQQIKNAVDVKEAIDRETEAKDRNTEAARKQNEELERQIELGLQQLAQEIQKDEMRKQQEAEASQIANSGVGGGIADALGVDLVSIFDPEKINVIKTHAQFIKDVYNDIARTAGQAIGGMVQGLAQLVTAWVTTGKFSAKAALQMAAGVAIGLAMQAAMKAIFEQAEAIAAAARWDFVSAALHEAAAAMYWKVAIVAGAIGVGLGLASRAFGNGGGSNAAGSAFASQTGGQRSRDTSNQGRQYSSFGDEVAVVDTSANAPFRLAPVKVDLHVKLDSDGVLDVIEANADRDGRMKALIERYS